MILILRGSTFNASTDWDGLNEWIKPVVVWSNKFVTFTRTFTTSDMVELWYKGTGKERSGGSWRGWEYAWAREIKWWFCNVHSATQCCPGADKTWIGGIKIKKKSSRCCVGLSELNLCCNICVGMMGLKWESQDEILHPDGRRPVERRVFLQSGD